jgi:hypothetical protein
VNNEQRAAQVHERVAARSGHEMVARVLEAVERILDDAGGVHELLITTHKGRMTDLHRRRPKERI